MKCTETTCRISAIVCTYNGGPYLLKTIDSLLNQTLSKDSYEIIVVDNASTDGTRSAVKAYEEKNVRYIYQGKQGLSYSRNTGFKVSKSDIVAYIDDDAVACPEWLERLLNAFSVDRSIVAVGGKIRPIWESEKPRWIVPRLYTYFSCIDWSNEPCYLETGRYLYGCNMAFRRNILYDCGGFNTRLGRIGKSLLSNEEWQVFHYIDKKGFKKHYDPEIYVEHTIKSSRMNWKWLNERLYWQGVSNLYYDYFVKNATKTQVLNKYTKEGLSFFSRELKKLIQGKGDIILVSLFITRYIGASVHFVKICLGLTKR